MAVVRCGATTKSGTRCSITSLSNMRDSAGRCVAEPLRKGCAFCAMHTVLFPRAPAMACESIVAYIDLETNSLDVSGNIVEIGALVDDSRATRVNKSYLMLEHSLDHSGTRLWLVPGGNACNPRWHNSLSLDARRAKAIFPSKCLD